MEMPYYQKIRNIREDNDIKQYELANYLNIKFKTYNLYENGLREFPLEVISKILMRFNISFDYILGLSDNKSVNKK